MKIRRTASIITAKILIKLLRVLNRGGTSLPGKVARFIYPGILPDLASHYRILMVTGTNGKTTTTRMIAKMLDESGVSYISNRSGSNLVAGVISLLIEHANLCKISSIHLALIEMDEAAFRVATDFLKPEILVVTNFFRDQLDRYGELYSTLNKVKEGIHKTPLTTLVLNADDSLCASLGKTAKNPVLYYGMAPTVGTGITEPNSADASFCIFCKTKYTYSNHTYAHLGGFSCAGCGYHRPHTAVTCTSLEELTDNDSHIAVQMDEKENQTGVLSMRVNLPGIYNIYNALAALAFSAVRGIPKETAIKALESFESGFGRMETIAVGGKNIKVILVKNPTGFNQVIHYLASLEKEAVAAFLINDQLADGTDISWLWDVDFEKLAPMQAHYHALITSGDRAEDMAVRLKYAGIETSKISIQKQYHELIEYGLSRTQEGQCFYIMPTYTAMLDVRKVLKKQFQLKDFWK